MVFGKAEENNYAMMQMEEIAFTQLNCSQLLQGEI